MRIWKTVKDERVINLENKINSNAFHIATGLFVISIVVKAIFYRNTVVWADSMIYIDALIFVIPSMYVLLRNMLDGNDNFALSKKHIVIGILCGLLTAILIAILSSHSNWHIVVQRALSGFVISSVGINLIYYILGTISKKVAQKRDKQITQDCNNE